MWSLSLIKINNLPFLMSSTVVAVDTYWSSFFVLISFNFKDLAALPVDELAVLILENLEPSRVGAPDLHIIGSSSTLDVPRLVVVSGSDGKRLLMEVPNLCVSSIWSLEHHVSVID